MNKNDIYIDIARNTIIKGISLFEGDVDTENPYCIVILEDDCRKDLTGFTAQMAVANDMTKSGRILKVEIGDAKKGEILLPITENLTGIAGAFTCQLHLSKKDDTKVYERYTGEFSLSVEKNRFNYISQEITQTENWKDYINALQEYPLTLAGMLDYSFYQCTLHKDDYILQNDGNYEAKIKIMNVKIPTWFCGKAYNFETEKTELAFGIVSEKDFDKDNNYILSLRFATNEARKIGFRKIETFDSFLCLEDFAINNISEDERINMNLEQVKNIALEVSNNLKLNNTLNYNYRSSCVFPIDDKYEILKVEISYNNNNLTEDQANQIKNYIYPLFLNKGKYLWIKLTAKFAKEGNQCNNFYYNLMENKWINKEDINL